MTEESVEDIEERMMRAVEEANERIRTCHERVACPKCLAPVGARCRRALRSMMRTGVFATGQPELKHPHRERWTLVQAPR